MNSIIPEWLQTQILWQKSRSSFWSQLIIQSAEGEHMLLGLLQTHYTWDRLLLIPADRTEAQRESIHQRSTLTDRMQPKADRTTCSDWHTKNLQSSLRLGMWSPNMMINNEPKGFIYSILAGATSGYLLTVTSHKEIW